MFKVIQVTSARAWIRVIITAGWWRHVYFNVTPKSRAQVCQVDVAKILKSKASALHVSLLFIDFASKLSPHCRRHAPNMKLGSFWSSLIDSLLSCSSICATSFSLQYTSWRQDEASGGHLKLLLQVHFQAFSSFYLNENTHLTDWVLCTAQLTRRTFVMLVSFLLGCQPRLS